MRRKPVLWVLVGGNGAGKSTFYKHKLAHLDIPFVNADEIAKGYAQTIDDEVTLRAAQEAQALREQLLRERRSFCMETVFSHPSKVDLLLSAKRHGYEITLVYIHLQLEDLHVNRVSQRVRAGGHDVPEERLRRRLPRLRENVSAALNFVDFAYFFDNTSAETPYQFIVKLEHGRPVQWGDTTPDWALRMIAD
ncbi:AAA family ATPase [Hahella aquimaris]|uniref:AAA family ATPase n=1 Tax=Hahella sp. HNIBRBA332 TaxID=3015983 RepID=UPI00273CCB01|nr:AAA family ATPase [Hahella sp. HNIBRBA332]WLQ12888.1 AAA family ATPase [Hahella sp. HNIBRBA332]